MLEKGPLSIFRIFRVDTKCGILCVILCGKLAILSVIFKMQYFDSLVRFQQKQKTKFENMFLKSLLSNNEESSLASPPVEFLKPGDTVKCSIEGIGELENTIVQEKI